MKEYGFDSIIKEYAGFCKHLNLPCHVEHGWTKLSEPLRTDLKTKKKLMLVFSKRRAKAWRKHSNIHVEIMGAPFVIYRQMQGIIKKNNAKGTIVFPAHSCLNLEAVYNVDKFCDDLMQLDQKYHPFTICLHPFDFHSKVKLAYMENGFKVVTAEATEEGSFVENFYSLLSNHQFAVSNEIGSAAFYAVEMGIPFFLVGEIPTELNDGFEPNTPQSANYFDYEEGRTAYSLFKLPTDTINEAQLEYVRDEIGSNECIQPKELKYLLYKYYFKYNLFTGIVEKTKNMIKEILKKYKILLCMWQTYYAKLYIYKNRLSVESKIFSHMTLVERVTLHKLLSRNNRRLICVEIGSYLGASSTFIANAIGEHGRLFCIDTWGNHFMDYGDGSVDATERDTFKDFNANTFKYKKRIVLVREWSTEAIKQIYSCVKNIDFLLIDGDHNYLGVKSDWDLYSPLLKKDSYVAFHDTGWAEGVKKVVNEDVLLRATLVKKLSNMEIYKMEKDA